MGFPRQEYWSVFPCPPPGDLPDPGTEPMSLMSPALACGFVTTGPPGKPKLNITYALFFYNFITILWMIIDSLGTISKVESRTIKIKENIKRIRRVTHGAIK